LIYGVLTLAKWREDTERMLAFKKALAEAQLAQLQAQLRPHFIFNTLNTVSALMHTDVARADRVLAQLGDLLRASLKVNRQEEVSLKEELELLERYTEIMGERFGGRVSVQWKVDESTLPARVPAMLLQPILENAFKHGIERSSAAERITIRTARSGDSLRIDIHNTGPRLTNGSNGGVGLQNCRERLYLLYESQAELTVGDGEDSGVVASVTLPWRAAAH
jgi:LytS/YehU family sensor histidine kinase